MAHLSILILTIGIPGAGKTTWVDQYVKEHPSTFVISTDKIRKELTGDEQCLHPCQNDMIHDEARRRVKEIIGNSHNYGGNHGFGPTIVVDSTNCEADEWFQYKKLGASIMIAKVFKLTPDEAMSRQMGRERKVPFDILQMKYTQLLHDEKFLPCFFNLIW